jgi:hypothetical protein
MGANGILAYARKKPIPQVGVIPDDGAPLHMQHFDRQDTREVLADLPVRGRDFLSGSTSRHFPATIPLMDGARLTLRARWAGESAQEDALRCRPVIDAYLGKAGSMLLRGLGLHSPECFETFMAALNYPQCTYSGGLAALLRNSSRSPGLEDARLTLTPHNEMASLVRFPRKVVIFCLQEARAGAEIVLNEVPRVLELLPECILKPFRDKSIAYVRVLPPRSDAFQVAWPEVLAMPERANAERYLRQQGFQFEWLRGDMLMLAYRMAAFLKHPESGQELWFNQVTELHASYWEAHPQFPQYAWKYPTAPGTTTYGDGTAIDPEVITYLRGMLWQGAAAIKLQRGDVLVLDNLLVQSGRMPFAGPRQHLTSITG